MQTGFGDHLASYPIGTGASFPGGKATSPPFIIMDIKAKRTLHPLCLFHMFYNNMKFVILNMLWDRILREFEGTAILHETIQTMLTIKVTFSCFSEKFSLVTFNCFSEKFSLHCPKQGQSSPVCTKLLRCSDSRLHYMAGKLRLLHNLTAASNVN
jgi:hypothetical protein